MWAWDLNMKGLLNVLEVARSHKLERIFWPSSIAAFGPGTPQDHTPQKTVMDPSTVYGISKLAGEGWCAWYHQHHGVDVRSLRYPGLISWKTPPGGGTTDYAVEDHAWRLYRARGGNTEKLPPWFVTALEISAHAHEEMVAAVAPYVDTSISKSVNVPENYPYSEFQYLYFRAWKSGLKGLATYRPNSVLGSVLSVEPSGKDKAPQDFRIDDVNRRLVESEALKGARPEHCQGAARTARGNHHHHQHRWSRQLLHGTDP